MGIWPDSHATVVTSHARQPQPALASQPHAFSMHDVPAPNNCLQHAARTVRSLNFDAGNHQPSEHTANRVVAAQYLQDLPSLN